MITVSDIVDRKIRKKGMTFMQVYTKLNKSGHLNRAMKTNRWTKQALKDIGDVIGEDLTHLANIKGWNDGKIGKMQEGEE